MSSSCSCCEVHWMCDLNLHSDYSQFRRGVTARAQNPLSSAPIPKSPACATLALAIAAGARGLRRGSETPPARPRGHAPATPPRRCRGSNRVAANVLGGDAQRFAMGQDVPLLVVGGVRLCGAEFPGRKVRFAPIPRFPPRRRRCVRRRSSSTRSGGILPPGGGRGLQFRAPEAGR